MADPAPALADGPGMAPRHVVVSGASSGIGLATARRFAAGGDRVTNIDVRVPAEAVPGVRWVEGDVADWEAAAAVMARAEQIHGPPEVVVANAGISVRGAVLDCRQDDFRRMFEVNVLGVVSLWRHGAARMLGGSGGVLLATASTNGLVGYPLYAGYNATKAAVLSLCRSFALELAPSIRVATVSPGYVMTPMQAAEYSDAMIAAVNRRIPLGRHATPEEIADAFHYLASPSASFLTGQTLVLDGGELAGGIASGPATPEHSDQPSSWRADDF